MKRVATISILLLLILIFGIGSLCWLKTVTNGFSARLEQLDSVSEPSEALNALAGIQEEWEQKKRWIGVFVREEPLTEISDRLEECAALLRTGNTDDFSVRLRQTVFSIRDLYQRERPSLQNIL